ncbi:MAG: hypothetical protein ACOZNI_15405 [Myxococcota bacterium]
MLLLSAVALADAPYTRLHDRLASEFMVVGPSVGESIPATRRVDSTASMKWADATIQLGWYLGALAIEEAILADPDVLPGFSDGRTHEQVVEELALALAAVDRLDDHAGDGFPDCAGPWGMDGFFVRDDVPADFGARFDGITVVESDWIDPTLTNKEMSQDQVIHVLVGLALVAKYTDPALEVDGVALRQQAVDAALRIGEHVAAGGDWVIVNPGCDDRPVNRGEAAQFYSTAFVAVVEAITGEVVAEDLFPDAWQESADPEFVGWENANNLHMAMALAAAGDAWGDDTYADLVWLAEAYGWEAYPALHAALWGLPGEADAAALRDRLDAQLEEIGDGEPASPWPYGPSPNGWTTWHRYITPADEHYLGSEGTEDFRYPGTDWLLARMLYAANFEADWPEDTPDAGSPTGGGACGCSGGSALLVLPWLWRRRYSYPTIRPPGAR